MPNPLAEWNLDAWIQRQLGAWTGGYYDPVTGLLVSQWIGLIGLFVVGMVLGWLVQQAMFLFIRPRPDIEHDDWQEVLLERLPRPMKYAIALLTVRIGETFLGLDPSESNVLLLIIEVLLIAVLTWCALRVLAVGATYLESRLTRGIDDPLERQAIHTQITVPRGILRAVVMVVGAALILLQFEVVRSVGVSLLASAGVAGLVIGFAAQKTVSNILAGLQLAVFQPIKIGDVVVVEGEWGRIDKINLTFVTVKIWDERRLVLPVTYFTEKPFQNWTMSENQLLGTIYIYTDYTVPVDEIREGLKKILDESDLWDGRVEGVVVTALKPDTVEVRALISAADSSDQWNLRCHVREKLLEWMQQRQEHMPKFRVEMKPQPS